jgi:ribonuclease HI
VFGLPRKDPAAGGPATPAGRARSLRGLQTDPLLPGVSILKFTAWVDGASRGNPGPAGYGAFIRTDGGQIIEASGYLGTTTNNVAEYSGLLEALEIALSEGASDLDVISDSLLLVNQMLGKYRVKHPNLVPLHRKARDLSRRFARFSIRHTLRAGNKDADRLANLAVDRGEGRVIEKL